MIKRIINAARFYEDEFKREGAKAITAIKASRSNKPSFSYMGWVGHNNLGDEILYDAHKVLFAGENVVPFTQSNIVKAVQKLSKKPAYKAGILGGGTLINQSSSWITQMRALQARQPELPLFCLGTGVTEDAFRAKHEQTSLKEWVGVLEGFEFVGVRGPYSLAALEKAGFAKAVITGDTALSLAPDTFTPRTKHKVIGFNYGLVKENQIWGDPNSYSEQVAQTIKQLLDQGFEVRLLPVWDKDIASNKALLERVSDPRCTMVECFDTLGHYVAELEKCDLFIGQKLHATIMACMQRVPSVMVEYQPKCRDFMASVDMEQYIIKTSDFTPDAVQKLVGELIAKTPQLQKKLDTRIMGYKKIQSDIARRLESQLL